MRLADLWRVSLSGRSDRARAERGQVVLSAKVNGGPDAMLLTPKNPAGSPAP